jgi:hypothetical protein
MNRPRRAIIPCFKMSEIRVSVTRDAPFYEYARSVPITGVDSRPGGSYVYRGRSRMFHARVHVLDDSTLFGLAVVWKVKV